ncbi:ATP-binding protein [Pseudonocardia kujensis]|uniref:AAA family ATPase n=1 Tax=Pseudonocardia kujensis TaxID=1128675 RepID=UPI001E5B6CF7|nr:AAA family ATPase [Pseudonocardia kujensis]MCE0768171.1 ATP-binding protein [Pseudonocardia kujensis]
MSLATVPGDTPPRPLPLPLGPGLAAGGAAAPVRLSVPGRALVLVAGVPGAGKSTLLRRMPQRPGLRVFDSETQRDLLTRVLPGVPYPRIRALVHFLHRVAAVLAATGSARVVVVHLPATSTRLRRLVRGLARLTGRAAYLVWIDAAPEEALRGQADRGRVIQSRSFARHVRRADGVAAAIRAGTLGEPWARTISLDRPTAARGLAVAP